MSSSSLAEHIVDSRKVRKTPRAKNTFATTPLAPELGLCGLSAAHTFTFHTRVYYEDTDAGGIVFYANYLKFFERARTEWLRQLGIGQQALSAQTGTYFIVRQTSVDYRAPARLDDLVQIVSRIQYLGRASVEFIQQAWSNDKLLAIGTIRIGCIAAINFKPVAFPTPVLDVLRPLVAA